MLIVALVLAVVSLAALVTAVVTSNEVLAWVCIGLSGLGVLLLIVDAIRDRNRRAVAAPAELESDRTEVLEPVIDPVAATAVVGTFGGSEGASASVDFESADGPVLDDVLDDAQDADTSVIADYPELIEDHPEELVDDEPDHDMPSDDEADYPVPAEEAAMHTVTDDEAAGETADATAEFDEYADSAATIVYASESSDGSDHYIVIYPDDLAAAQSSDEAIEDDVPEDSSEAQEAGHQQP